MEKPKGDLFSMMTNIRKIGKIDFDPQNQEKARTAEIEKQKCN